MFINSAEVTKYIGGIFDTAFDDPEIGPKLVDTGLVVAFDFTSSRQATQVDRQSYSFMAFRSVGSPGPDR